MHDITMTLTLKGHYVPVPARKGGVTHTHAHTRTHTHTLTHTHAHTHSLQNRIS